MFDSIKQKKTEEHALCFTGWPPRDLFNHASLDGVEAFAKCDWGRMPSGAGEGFREEVTFANGFRRVVGVGKVTCVSFPLAAVRREVM